MFISQICLCVLAAHPTLEDQNSYFHDFYHYVHGFGNLKQALTAKE